MRGWAWGAGVALALAAGAAGGTTLEVVYGEGVDDATVVTALADNPGTTLGAQRRFAHEHAARLVERVVWVPDERPLVSHVGWAPFARGFAKAAVACHALEEEEAMDLGLEAGVCYAESFLTLHGADFAPDEGADEGMSLLVQYNTGRSFNHGLTPEPGQEPPNFLVATALHEYIHHLGFASFLPMSKDMPMPLESAIFTQYDLHLRLEGDATPSRELDEAMLLRLVSGMHDVNWLGMGTAAAAPRLLMAGYDQNGAVALTVSTSAGSHLSHLSYEVRPRSLMYASSEETVELGIVAYMLSDMGWGPVVDSAVSLEADWQEVTATVAADGLAERVVVKAHLPEGLRALSVLGTPASCETADAVDGMADETVGGIADQAASETAGEAVGGIANQAASETAGETVGRIADQAASDLAREMTGETKGEAAGGTAGSAASEMGGGTTGQVVTCSYSELQGAASIAYMLVGAPGRWTVAVDVEQRSAHVDPSPANNFASVAVDVTSPGFDGVTLAPAAVAEGRPANTEVGAFGIVGPAEGFAYDYALVAGGEHNACFRVDGDRLLTTRPFDRAAAPRLGIRVMATDSGGFSREQDLQVEVLADTVAARWGWPALAYAADTPNASKGAGVKTASLGKMLLASLLALAAAGAFRQRQRIGRLGKWALAAVALTLAASCGGGGGGSSGGGGVSPPPPPPPPPFTCAAP